MANGQPTPIQKAVADYRAIQARFEQRLWERWKEAFDLYDAVLVEAQNIAVYFFKHHRAQAVAQKDALYETVTWLHT